MTELSYRYKGWSLDREGLDDLADKINQAYDFAFIPETALGSTSRIRLYRGDLKVYLYQAALNHMSRMPRAELLDIFEKYYDEPDNTACERVGGGPRERNACKRIRSFFAARSKFNRAFLDKKPKDYADGAVKMVSAAEAFLSGDDFITVIGGKQNLYAFSRLSGFRESDENGDKTFTSSSIGEFGNANIAGPITKIIKDINVTRGEFYALWLRSRL